MQFQITVNALNYIWKDCTDISVTWSSGLAVGWLVGRHCSAPWLSSQSADNASISAANLQWTAAEFSLRLQEKYSVLGSTRGTVWQVNRKHKIHSSFQNWLYIICFLASWARWLNWSAACKNCGPTPFLPQLDRCYVAVSEQSSSVRSANKQIHSGFHPSHW